MLIPRKCIQLINVVVGEFINLQKSWFCVSCKSKVSHVSNLASRHSMEFIASSQMQGESINNGTREYIRKSIQMEVMIFHFHE